MNAFHHRRGCLLNVVRFKYLYTLSVSDICTTYLAFWLSDGIIWTGVVGIPTSLESDPRSVRRVLCHLRRGSDREGSTKTSDLGPLQWRHVPPPWLVDIVARGWNSYYKSLFLSWAFQDRIWSVRLELNLKVSPHASLPAPRQIWSATTGELLLQLPSEKALRRLHDGVVVSLRDRRLVLWGCCLSLKRSMSVGNAHFFKLEGEREQSTRRADV